MSRRTFRGELSAPRPLAAYGMSAAATATLAVSGQVSAPVLAAATILGCVSLWRRNAPLVVQRSALLLNGLLFAVLSVSILLWWWGSPAIVALAHLATGTLGLKLFDARPRKSEFLLVSLALLQVVAAANLTDSVFYPILLAAFAAFAVWTLLVHTLSCEALEAGLPGAEREVLSKGLFKVTLLASLVTFLLALAIFPLLPRMRSGAFVASQVGSMARSGFSDRVALGDIGQIRKDARPALRVEIVRGDWPEPDDAYWRGLAFDHFDGRTWTVSSRRRTQLSGNASVGMVFAEARREASVHRIFREAIDTGVLFSAGAAAGLRGSVGRVDRDANGSLYAQKTVGRRIEYMVRSLPERPPADHLRDDRATAPGDGDRYLERLSDRPVIRNLAGEIRGKRGTDYDQIAAVERYLIENGRYTDSPPSYGEGGLSPIEAFLLGERAGHCEYFASAMVLLLREMGYPARLVTGFAGGERNELGNFIALSRADAHSWVEVHFESAGWVRFDPTPPDLRLAGSARLSARDQLNELASAIELWWFRNFVDYDRDRQLKAFTWMARQVGGWSRDSDADAGRARQPSVGGVGLWIVAGVLLAFAAALWLSRGPRNSGKREPSREYKRALLLLARRGVRREASCSARDFAERIRRSQGPEAGEVFTRMTERYLAQRFGEAPETAADLRELGILRRALGKKAA